MKTWLKGLTLKKAALGGYAVAVTLILVGGCAKSVEQFNDADVSVSNDKAAERYSMPDGFGNFASKCDNHGNRVYTLFHKDSPYGAIAVVPKDPSCAL